MRALLIEDDTKITAALARGLREEGFAVEVAHRAGTGLTLLATETFDVVILDWRLPDRSGLDLLQDRRRAGDQTPVIMLTARDAVADKIQGLDAGADDYLVKPFSLAELFARIRAVTRRDREQASVVLEAGALQLDPLTRQANIDGRPLDLTAREFQLLALLVRNRGRVMTRSIIADQIWGLDFAATSNVIDVHVRRLRQKLEAAGERRLLFTVRGVGYRLSAVSSGESTR